MKNAVKLFSAIALVLLVSAFTLNNTSTNEGYKIGDVVDEFSLESTANEMVSMSNFEDAKGFIITFTCNTCPFAVAYEDRIIELNNKYASKGFPVIAIMPNNTDVKPDDNLEAMATRAKSKGFTFPYVIDKDQKVYPKFGATKTPHVYVLEKTKKGNVVKYIGAIDDNYKDASAVKVKYVENAIDALLEGKEIEQTETKAVGCSIKV